MTTLANGKKRTIPNQGPLPVGTIAREASRISSPSRYRRLCLAERERLVRPDFPQDINQIKPGLRAVLSQLAAGEARWPLFLWGHAGRGKTCAAVCLASLVLERCYVTAEQIIDLVYEREAWLWRQAKEASLVVVDELASRDKVESREYTAIKRMADLREFRPAIWITNHSPVEIKQLYDERISSRICSGTVVELTGLDRRFEGK